MLRVATYNIRKCVGLDWRRRPERVVQVLGELHADVVGLQEADRRLGERPATLPPSSLADRSNLSFAELPSDGVSSGHHGNAILVRCGTVVTRCVPLDLPSLEPRGALVADLELVGLKLRVACIHLGLRAADRRRQAKALASRLAAFGDARPTIILGDVNEWTALGAATMELSKQFQASRPLASFHTSAPVAPLDRIFVGHGLRIDTVHVHRSAASRRASDHLPVCAEVSAVAHDATPLKEAPR